MKSQGDHFYQQAKVAAERLVLQQCIMMDGQNQIASWSALSSSCFKQHAYL